MLPRISLVEGKDAKYLLFSTKDLISNTIFQTGKWEEHIQAISKLFLTAYESPLLLDIGANIGAYSIPLAKSIGEIGGKVIAFEPQRIVYYQLCANIILNRLDNYYAVNSAVGEKQCDIDIPELDYELSTNIGAFSINKEYREKHGIEKSVKKTFNKVNMISLNGLKVEKPPALIKIDVEGFELTVFKGAKNFLEKNNFPPILFEAWSKEWFSEDKEELLAYVRNLGYEITRLGKSDYIAQHLNNLVRVDFLTDSNGVINGAKVKRNKI